MTIKIKLQEKNYDCNECIIKLKHWFRFSKGKVFILEVPIKKLYEGYIDGKCPVMWDEVNGFSFTEKFNVTYEYNG